MEASSVALAAKPQADSVGWLVRVVAYLIDGVTQVAIALVIIAPGIVTDAFVDGRPGSIIRLIFVVTGVVLMLVSPALFAARRGVRNGQTLGKQVMKIRAVTPDGPITLGKAFIREVLIKNVLGQVAFGIFTLIDGFWLLLHAQNKAIHDLMVDTRVVEAK